jgi:hypothetical protein
MRRVSAREQVRFTFENSERLERSERRGIPAGLVLPNEVVAVLAV